MADSSNPPNPETSKEGEGEEGEEGEVEDSQADTTDQTAKKQRRRGSKRKGASRKGSRRSTIARQKSRQKIKEQHEEEEEEGEGQEGATKEGEEEREEGEGSKAPASDENDEDEEEEEESPKKKKEKPEIPIDFYYEVEHLQSRPAKSDDDLPEGLFMLFHSFGYPCHVRNNLRALSNSRLIFGAGCYLEIMHLDTAPDYHLTYMRTTGGGSVGAITVHPSGKFFAVGEKGSSPSVNIYNADDYRLYRILRNATTKAYNSLCFNEKGDLLASQGGEPDHMVTVWNWIQEAILLRCKAFSQDVYHVSFNRELQGKLCTAGSGHIKFWTMARTFTGLKLQGQVGRFGRSPISDIEGFLEFPDGKVLTGSDWGNLLLWEEQLIKVQIGRKGGKPCHTGQVMHMRMVEGEIITAGTDGYVRSWNYELVDMLEADEESGLVELDPMNEVLIGASVQVFNLTQPRRMKVPKAEDETAENPSESDEDSSMRHMWYCQDGAGGIWQADLSFRLAALSPKQLLNVHSGPIAACAVSPRTYLVMTLGEDGTLRLYEILKKKLLAVKHFKAKGSCLEWIPLCVDNQCASVMAGFSDGVIRRVAIDGSTTTTFGVNRSEVQLKLLQPLKPHSGAVSALAYSRSEWTTGGDRLCTLATCSEDQTLFFFNVFAHNQYHPHCYVPLNRVPRHLLWSHDDSTSDHLLLLCDGGVVMEIVQPRVVHKQDTLEFRSVQMRALKFSSIKSQVLHDLELEKETQEEEEKQEERDKQNQALLEKGLETPSQQNLRVEAENVATAAERRDKERDEEPWEPYIPPVPSPVLQALYAKGGDNFWLLLGSYDSGYFYECQFQDHFRILDVDEDPLDPRETPPVRAVPIIGGTDDVVTAITVGIDGQFVFLGMQDGSIRVLFLAQDNDISSQCKFWSLGVHDIVYGAVRGLAMNHDEAFLITVGQDGNFFIFSMFGENELDQYIQVCSEIPTGALGEEAASEDLGPDSYTIEQAKQKADQDHLLKLAEKRKQDRRMEIATLRAKFMDLQHRNKELPAHHRLTRDEFLMDKSLTQDIQEHKKKKLAQLHRELAWEQERSELRFKKVHDFYRRNITSDHFCVRALNSPHAIHSYRLERDDRKESMFHSHRTTVIASDSDAEEESTKDDSENAELAEMLGSSLSNLENIKGASQRIQYLLKKVHMKRIKRARRKIAWRRFLATKPADDVEDPNDLEAIRHAKDTLGDRPLKAEDSYVVPDTYRLTMADGAMRLRLCQGNLQKLQSNFNRKLLALREEKVNVLVEIRFNQGSLVNLQKRLEIDHMCKVLPHCPVMEPDEQPGGQFKIDAHTESMLRDEVRNRQQKQLQPQTPEGTRDSSFTKSRRRSSFAIARESIFKRKQSFKLPEESSEAQKDALYAGHRDSLEDIKSDLGLHLPHRVALVDEQEMTFSDSSLWEEMKAVEEIKLQYVQSRLVKVIKEKKRLFDIGHRQLRHEKFALDVLVKCGHLRVTTLQEEQLLLMECENVEEEITDRINTCLEQKGEADRTTKQLQTHIAKMGKDMEENTREDKALYVKLETIIGENNTFHDYLVKVYKKKVKRKKMKRSADSEEASGSSESESSSSESESESGEEDEDVIHYDLNMCPASCSRDIYDSVVALREERLDLDDQSTELKRNKDALVKDVDAFAKKRQGFDATLTKAQKELTAFQVEKQKRINDLYTVCTLQLHQIQCLRRNGEFHALSDELLLSEEELIRLQNRILELKEEKKEEKKQTVLRKKLHVHLQHERRLFLEKLEVMEETCEKEMMKKFGQIVDLETVETVVADPQVEDIRSRLNNLQQENDRVLQVKGREVSSLKRTNMHSLNLDSEYRNLEAEMKVRLLSLEKDLDRHLDPSSKRKQCSLQDESNRPSKDMRRIMDVVTEQREVIKDLLHQIKDLQGAPEPRECEEI